LEGLGEGLSPQILKEEVRGPLLVQLRKSKSAMREKILIPAGLRSRFSVRCPEQLL
jgi:hypothetical protein